ncbi:MAG TPA: YceI family protein [Verrucomicrobium sp.]|nr:YceI family protein [Verrucomicrobium sp.]
MNISTLPAALLALALVSFAPAQAEDTQRWSGTSTIGFAGTSTLHDWSGKVSAEPFTATVTLDDKGQPAALKATVQVKAAGMDTAEPKRDDNMHSAMRVTDYPLISAAMNAPFTQVMGGSTPARLPFSLSLVGKKEDVVGTISNWKLKGDTATFDLDFEVSMKKYGITVPSVLLVIRVGDTVKIHAEVKLTRKSA